MVDLEDVAFLAIENFLHTVGESTVPYIYKHFLCLSISFIDDSLCKLKVSGKVRIKSGGRVIYLA